MPGSTPAVEPPPFQEAAHCDVCKCGFNAFRRRHHCRCCGRTLCHEHSSDQMALPQYGTYTNVRVCSDCFNNSTGQRKNEAPSIPNLVAATAEDISRLDMGVDIDSKPQTTTVVVPTQSAPECKCGMPLCICTTALPDPVPEVKMADVPPVRSSPRPIKANNTKRTAESVSNNVASSSSKPSIFFNMGQQAISRVDQDHGKYEVNGDGLREAIKYSDVKAVKRLLDEGVDPNYRDKQGLSLLHLAALFNQTEIAFILMDHGASLESKNAQGETPLDCAPTMLQYKMRQKMGAGP
ncbi:unnamed protein product [Spirodela intermedia]|uniref:FYVE-type domain-containing protein n=1 Tax=Spirodela intermedia TaxID=51605 RepID=A0A7I8KB45_SPIIN|nr:unnamed protein product [Spirodela intermedia]